MAYKHLAGGACNEDLENRRNDESFLGMLGATRLPDPATVGELCRRFKSKKLIDTSQEAIDGVRLKVWQ